MPTAPEHLRPDGGPARRAAVAVVLVLIVALAVALPWLVPALPRLLGDHVASGPHRVTDPPVAPPTADPVTPSAPGPSAASTPNPLAGVRLRSAGRPVRVWVPRLSVRSEVVPISGNSGTLLPPSDPQELGWWQEGPVPGASKGTAVLTGHTVHTGGGALDHLRQLVTGDEVRVATDAGTIRYRVVSVRNLSTRALALHSRDIFALGGQGRLVLITCTNWNGTTYLANTVVAATPVGQHVQAS